MLQQLMDKIAEIAEIEFKPPSEAELTMLKSLNLPEEYYDHFAHFNASDDIEIGDTRIWSIPSIISESFELVPGRELLKHGLIVFASNYSGDAYCFDTTKSLESTPILLFDHEESYDGLTRDQAIKSGKVFAENLLEFLQFILNEADE
ncbi:SMI1/KNR4 family protein [Brevibacillus porteri]|uniref:SMI1/KNR4 family protein n=1 Tax=Brevibacillus porteri TaxID=2126350 RepID=UPI003D19A6B5